MRKILFIFLVITSAPTLFAQQTPPTQQAQQSQQTKAEKKQERQQKINALIQQDEEGVVTYTKSTAFGFKLVNDGYGAFLEIGRAKSVKKSLLFQFDISERKNIKEEKQTNPQYAGPALIFGKINFFYPVKLGVQQQFLLGNKNNKNGVSITGNLGGGLTLAFLRPYYLNVYDTSGTAIFRKAIRYESADSALFTDNYELYYLQASGPTFGQGWSDLKITPGAYAKAALRFDYGRYNEAITAIEVGVTAEFYTKGVPQLVYTDPQQLFLNAYVSIVFGKRK
jgi:hypothetical protein